MSHVHKSVCSLRVFGDDLDPGEITGLLGCGPTSARARGDKIVGRKSGTTGIACSGGWCLRASNQEPEDLDSQIGEILGKLSDDLAIWKDIGRRYQVDLFCGLFMEELNEGLSISPGSLVALGLRGIELGLDIYALAERGQTDG